MFLVSKIDKSSFAISDNPIALGVFTTITKAEDYLLRHPDFLSLVITEIETDIVLEEAPIAIKGYKIIGNLQNPEYTSIAKTVFAIPKLNTVEIESDDVSDFLISDSIFQTLTYIPEDSYDKAIQLYQELRYNYCTQLIEEVVEEIKTTLAPLIENQLITIFPSFSTIAVIIRINDSSDIPDYKDIVMQKSIIFLEVININFITSELLKLSSQERGIKLYQYLLSLAKFDVNYGAI